MHCQWKDKVLAVAASDFEKLALDLFHFQYENNEVYQQYTDALKINPRMVDDIGKIPYLPVRFFKSHIVASTHFEPAVFFESSGTTGSVNSRHYIKDTGIYKESFIKGFEHFYGPVKDWCIIGLLPSYLERGNSSLVFMVNELISLTNHEGSGFYLNEYEKLISLLCELEKQQQKTLLIGVTFALLDFAVFYQKNKGKSLNHTLIMETGGMKGRGKEMIRVEVHDKLKKAFQVPAVHSEYGMTELLSQAYAAGNGIFKCPSWLRVIIRDEDDPMHIKGKPGFQKVTSLSESSQTITPVTGVLNVIDLANIYSCCFIATDDLGRLFADGSFEVAGRIDNSDMRGCSLMVV